METMDTYDDGIYSLISVNYFTIAETLYEQASFIVRCFAVFKHFDLC